MGDHPESASAPNLLASKTWREADRTVLLVPLGSTEQHGRHLPLATDTLIATALATALADRLSQAMIAPAIAYGASGEHAEFPGTISIGTISLRDLLIEFGRSAAAWASRIVFVNGHGGNLEALTGAVVTLRAEGRDACWLPCALPRPRDAHAGFDETSLMLHLHPELVREEHAAPGATEQLATLLPRLRAQGVRAVSPDGVLGDPSGATAQHGARLFSQMRDLAWTSLSHGVIDDTGRLLAGPTP